MLYEFHHKQNSKKPDSVHATYLLTGTKLEATANGATGTTSHEDGEDTKMRSSPPLPSSSFQRPKEDEREAVATRTVMIVKEENLMQAKASFDTITGIHIYSVQAKGLGDIHTLAERKREFAADHALEDPLKEWKQYGVIQNPNVKRRERRNGAPHAMPAKTRDTAPAKKKETVPEMKDEPAKAEGVPTLTKQASTISNTSAKTATDPTRATTGKPTASQKDSSSIFKSFAKGAAAAVKSKKTESQQSSKAPSPAPAEDIPMTGFSDDDDDDDDGSAGLPDTPAITEPSGPSKKERKANLEAMMDMEDEPMEDAVATPEAGRDEDEEQHDEGAIDIPAAKEEPKESVIVENGRRRGRRRMMKKKTVRDEEGYLGKRSLTCFIAFKLTHYSYARRSCMGVLLGRRTRAQEGQSICPYGFDKQDYRKERCKARAGEHHVFLWEEISAISPNNSHLYDTSCLKSLADLP